jgi:hypothetical protein
VSSASVGSRRANEGREWRRIQLQASEAQEFLYNVHGIGRTAEHQKAREHPGQTTYRVPWLSTFFILRRRQT